jgi:hypothetical protein
MEIDPVELIREMEQQFPKELTICLQAIQIRKLQEQIPEESDRE